MRIEYFNSGRTLPAKDLNQVAEFLYNELGQYGDPKNLIEKAMQHSLSDSVNVGGFISVAYENDEIVGAAVINGTGFKEYIPENLLVYLAVNHTVRGQGIGRRLLEAVIERANGDIALHVDPDNPAIGLYNSLGFENKYLEMRLVKSRM